MLLLSGNCYLLLLFSCTSPLHLYKSALWPSLFDVTKTCPAVSVRGQAIASVRKENGLPEHFQMPMPCTVDAIQKACLLGSAPVASGWVEAKARSGAVDDARWRALGLELRLGGVFLVGRRERSCKADGQMSWDTSQQSQVTQDVTGA